MKFGFNFSNLCGTVYKQGNLIFTPDGNTLISPVGNRITVFDLLNHSSVTFPFESRKDIKLVALTPNETLLLCIDEDGRAVLVNYYKKIVLSYFNFKEKVHCIQFSPNGKFFAVGFHKKIQIWHTPSPLKEFTPFKLFKKLSPHFNDVISLDWSHDSKFLVSGSKDMTIKILKINGKKKSQFQPLTLSGHRDYLVNCYFLSKEKMLYSISRDGVVLVWKWQKCDKNENGLSAKNGTWIVQSKEYLKHNHAKVVCTALQKQSNLLVVGFSSGIFSLYNMPDLTNLHSLSISQKKISTVSINNTGEWIAFGAPDFGQLLVWEWKSETYILKQQGHSLDMNSLSYSPDGQFVATGGDDGKVKLWDTKSGFCFVTFSEHTAPVSGLQFASNGFSVVSSSLDGTVRAFDLIRYRNYRTLVSPAPTQFSCVAIDPSGEIVCAGGADVFEIYVWSLQTGNLLDVLSGHEGPISALSFNPIHSVLVSSSWDKTSKIWSVFENKTATESLLHGADVLTVAFRPDGNEICTATLDGNLQFWDTEEGSLLTTIEGRRDISGGRKSTDVRTAKTSTVGKCFNSVCYTADGRCIIAGGTSKFICIYEISQKILLKKFQTSSNRSLDGILDILNSSNMTEAGVPIQLLPDDDSDEETDKDYIPGSKKEVDSGKRTVKPAIKTKDVKFSPTGRQWSAITTEGLLIYSLDDITSFDPFDLELDITPENIEKTLKSGKYLEALVMSLKLNELDILQIVFESIPSTEIQVVAQSIPFHYLKSLILFISTNLEKSIHLEFHLLWCLHIFNFHGQNLKDNSAEFMSAFRNLQKNVSVYYDSLSKLCDENQYTLEYLLSMNYKKMEVD